jgi:hypothetical protein
MALCCEAFYVKQKQAKHSKRNAEPALKGWFSGFGKRSARAKPWPQIWAEQSKFPLNLKIIPATSSIFIKIIQSNSNQFIIAKSNSMANKCNAIIFQMQCNHLSNAMQNNSSSRCS